MVKGFIIYKNGKIPFVIDKYRMELFTDDKILNDFMQEHCEFPYKSRVMAT